MGFCRLTLLANGIFVKCMRKAEVLTREKAETLRDTILDLGEKNAVGLVHCACASYELSFEALGIFSEMQDLMTQAVVPRNHPCSMVAIQTMKNLIPDLLICQNLEQAVDELRDRIPLLHRDEKGWKYTLQNLCPKSTLKAY